MGYQGLEKIFTLNELYFPSPTKFNDPFDCKTAFCFNNCNENDFQAYIGGIKDYILKNNINVDLNKKIEGIDNKYYQRSIIDSYTVFLNEINKPLGIFCLSERPDDIIMWSHYADGHKGLVLQFDKAGLESYGYCKKVEYSKDYPTLRDLNESKSSDEGIAKLFLLRKADHWSYEAEWRMIINIINGKRIVKFPKEILTGVIFGCQADEKYKEKVSEWIDSSKMQVKIYEAVKDEESYSLKISL